MKLKDLLCRVSVKEIHADFDMEISGVSYDSRRTLPGDLFVAVVGYASDGHNFIDSACEKGAACIICERAPETDIPYVIAENTRRALAEIGAAWFDYPAEKMRMIGVTGTNGKTTTTNLIKTLLEKIDGRKVGLIGTNCNMIGEEILPTERTTPESFELQKLFRQMCDAGCAYVVMEVSSHSLYLDRVHMIPFEVGVFTNLTRDHLDFHKTMENYGAAKALLFKKCRRSVINIDDEYAHMMLEAAGDTAFTYSALSDNADMTAKNAEFFADKVTFLAVTIGELERVKLNIPGQFSVYNGLSALAAVTQLGFPLSKAAEAMASCSGVMGRAEVVPTGRDFSIIIDYAHTPDAMENIIKAVRPSVKGRLVMLFGCGGDRDRTKRPIMGALAAKMADFVIVTSDNPRTEEPGTIIKEILAGMENSDTPSIVIENRREAIGWAIRNAQTDDVIILAGKGHETYQEVGKVKNHFDEREVVAEYLRENNN